MGLFLRNPLIASASPLTGDVGRIRRLEDAGAAAIVLPSIFEEQITQEVREHAPDFDLWGFPEVAPWFPEPALYRVDPHHYLELIRRAVEAVDIPIIASVNGVTLRGWIDYARLIEESGARAIELNIYTIPTDLELTGRQIEQECLEVLRAVQAAVRIPIAVKLSPYFSALGRMVLELAEAGADAFVLFNRFYQPNIDAARLQLRNSLKLSEPGEIRLPLLWIRVLADRVSASLAASTGVESADEVAKYLLAGADAVMTTSSLLRHGIDHMRVLLTDLHSWCAQREFETLSRFKGVLSRRRLQTPEGIERANYIRIVQAYTVAPGRRL
jgi:dihydroorotate dehydrogenase (fumarate)